MSAPLLVVDRINKSFGGVHAVADVTFALDAGEIVAVIGPNGAGKSTLFNLLGGQLSPDSGRAFIADHVISGLSPMEIALRGVGRTFQVAATFASMTVRENLQMTLLAHRHKLVSLARSDAAWFGAEADALLERVDIAALAARTCGELAYGDLKRVEIAMALAARPQLLLMDEPTAGMAARERLLLMRIVVDLARRDRVAVLFTEHDMDVVFTHADRIVVLNRGRIIATGSPAEVRADAEVRRVYLGPETFGREHHA
jgi:branched-chain amino acid transport system ATP-binding protein